jgi:hypothetical protein
VETKQPAIAQKIFGSIRRYDGKDFFVCLARDGHTGAVEFFFPDVSSNVALLDQALLEAAKADRSDVVAFLLATKRIPSDLTKQAFVAAAGCAACSVVQYMTENKQVSSEAIGEGFISATEGRHLNLMQMLYDGQQISGEFVLEAFKKTWDIWTKPQKYLVEILRRIPPEFKHRAFVYAASTGKSTALKYLATRDLPFRVLKEAYETKVERSKVVVGTITCEQLFYSSANYMDRFD